MSIKYNALTVDFIDNKTENQNLVHVMFWLYIMMKKYVNKKLLVKHNMGFGLGKEQCCLQNCLL